MPEFWIVLVLGIAIGVCATAITVCVASDLGRVNRG